MAPSLEEEKPLLEPSRGSRKKKDQELPLTSSSVPESRDEEYEDMLGGEMDKKMEYDFTEEDDEQESLELSYQSTKKKRDCMEMPRDIEDELPQHEILTKHNTSGGGKKKKDKSSDEHGAEETSSVRNAKQKKKDFSYEEFAEELPSRGSRKKKEEVLPVMPSLVEPNEFDEDEDIPLAAKTSRKRGASKKKKKGNLNIEVDVSNLIETLDQSLEEEEAAQHPVPAPSDEKTELEASSEDLAEKQEALDEKMDVSMEDNAENIEPSGDDVEPSISTPAVSEEMKMEVDETIEESKPEAEVKNEGDVKESKEAVEEMSEPCENNNTTPKKSKLLEVRRRRPARGEKKEEAVQTPPVFGEEKERDSSLASETKDTDASETEPPATKIASKPRSSSSRKGRPKTNK